MVVREKDPSRPREKARHSEREKRVEESKKPSLMGEGVSFGDRWGENEQMGGQPMVAPT